MLCRCLMALSVVWALTLDCATSRAQETALKIGLLNDQNRPFADLTGAGSVVAARMAVEDFGGRVLGRPIEILVADSQNKPDVASRIATGWFDRDNVSAVFDLPISSVALAVQSAAQQRGKIAVVSGAGATALIGKACSPTGFLWAYNTYSLAHGTALALLKAGATPRFFITSDYTFGQQLEKDATDVVEANGGRVLGAARHPINTSDFSSYLLRAQASGAKVIGLANGGADTANAIKQAVEFGLMAAGQKVVALILFISDVRSIGLAQAQGLLLTSAFYWDQSERTRAWSRRFQERAGGRMPNELQAAVYSSVNHYLKALAQTGRDDGIAVAETMRAMPVTDFMTNGAKIRADGYVMRDFTLFQVKSPGESNGDWDYFKPLATISVEDAAPTTNGSSCALLKG